MQTQITNIGAFVGGLNTEMPQLADQIQYTTDELNCQLLPDGTRARRYGFNMEENATGIAASYIVDQGSTSEGFLVEYADDTPMTKEIYNSGGQKTYKIVLPETAVYTITMVGAGSYEGDDLGTHVDGAAGAGVTFSTMLEAGEYTVKVGYDYTYEYKRVEKHLLSKKEYYFRNGGATSIERSGVIKIVAGGATGAVKRKGNVSAWQTPTRAYSGTLTVTEHPTVFNIQSQTTDHQLEYENSFLTGDTTGFGAINKNGYFKITKGTSSDTTEVIDNGKSEAYYWANYDKEGKDCIVLQQGSLLRFFKAERPYDSEQIASIDTSTQIKDQNNFSKYSFSSGEGFLLVTSEYAEPFYITLSNAGTAAFVPITLQIRDLEGVTDGLNVEDEPTELSDRHKYNLLNQGWDTTKINSYYSSQHKYPSNAMIWWYGKDSNGDFNVSTLTKQYFGTTPAPRGHYVLDFFDQDRATASGISGLDKVTKNKYCVSSEFFAGRFFYLASSTVLFSQIIREDIRGIGKCYQEADPTSQTISDLIATDGGTIRFQDLGYGKRIKKFPLGLLVFGSKSVYAITSTTSNAFNATQYLTQFVTNAGCISGESVVGAEDVLYYWSPQGIYQIVVDNISGTQAIASSLSSSTIQQWYNNLPNFSKENCVGAYDYTNRRIVWMYPTDENDIDNKNGVLVYYVDFKAFMPSKISEGGKAITVFETVLPTFIVPSINLYADEQEVVAGTTDVIVKDFGEEYGRNFSVCYVGYIKEYDKIFFCDFNSREFTDWQTHLYKSFAISYPITFSSTWIKKYTPVVQCYFIRTEEDELTNGAYLAPSSCYLRARWKWGETQDSHRWDLSQEAYIHIPRFMEFRYVNGKIRVRGDGQSVQYMIESKEDNDFKLSGMNLEIRTA